ncbi:MAG: chorismate mutase [Hyphomonadaceae bacterium]|nr:chorismate mutase [Hyphomonadaceae bacterium]
MTEAPATETPAAALDAARAAIDAVDDRLLALIAERAGLSARIAAAKGVVEGSPLRPAREAQILRRLIAQAPAGLDPTLIVDVWRALIADNTRRQKCVEVFTGGASDHVRLFDLARRHFGAAARITRLEDARATLNRMLDVPAAAAVLPFPAKSGQGSWWPILSERRFHDTLLIAVLPMRDDGHDPEAAVLTRGAPLEPSGRDISVAIAFDPHHRLTRGLNEAALPGKEIARANATVLIQFETFVAPDDPRLTILGKGLDGLRVVGSYARV